MITTFMILSKTYPNDQEFGQKLRSITNISKYIPNDQDLGLYIRKKIKKYSKIMEVSNDREICEQFIIVNLLNKVDINTYKKIAKSKSNFSDKLLIDEPTIKEVVYNYESGNIIMKTYTDKESVSYFTNVYVKEFEINNK